MKGLYLISVSDQDGLVAANVLCRKGKQGNVTGPLDRNGQAALMPGASAGLAPGLDLAAIGEIPAEGWHVLIVDRFGLF
jgi:hypothetical protein